MAKVNGQNSDNTKEAKDLKDLPINVHNIHIGGLGRTKDDIVKQQVSSIFKSTDFHSLIGNVQVSLSKIEALGLFKNVKVFIDTSKTGSDLDYDVYFSVKEIRRLTGGISTLVGTNDGSLLFSLQAPNTLGRGERLMANYEYGTKSSAGSAVTFRKFLAADPNLVFSLGLQRHKGDFPWSGYKEIQRGVFSELNFGTLLGTHTLRWDGLWRELGCLSNTSSFEVRKESGHSLKSSVQHILTRDTRDDKVLPSSGYLATCSQEFAGLGGDSHFVKQDLELQLNKSLFLDSVVQLTCAGGLIKAIPPNTGIRIQDRFFLGGPLTLRGFNLKGCGPSQDSCSLGASFYLQGGLHLYTPLPFRPGQGGFGDLFRTHFFVNAGNLTNINLNNKMSAHMSDLMDTLRLSYGAGVVLKLGGIARLELNYCVPVKSQASDSITPGFQFGVGINFL